MLVMTVTLPVMLGTVCGRCVMLKRSAQEVEILIVFMVQMVLVIVVVVDKVVPAAVNIGYSGRNSFAGITRGLLYEC